MISCLDGIISGAALRWPDKVALIDHGRAVTYAELDRYIQNLANVLLSKGLEKGERAGILARNSIESAAVYFAILRAGGAAVPLNNTLSSSDIIKYASGCSISAIYIENALEEKGKAVIENVKSLRFVVSGADNEISEKNIKIDVSENDPAFIIYTAGTTRDPLGVMLSHKNLISNNMSIVKYMNITNTDIACCVLPFYYIFGLSLLLSYLMAGATVIIENRFLYPNTVLDTIDKYKATAFAGVSSHYAILLYNSDLRNRKLPSLKCFMQAGDSMNVSITKELLRLFPDKKLYIMYGQTEASPRLTYLDPGLAAIKPNSAGKAIPGVEIKLINEKGGECGPGETGEIIARGDSIMLGYWDNAKETASAVREGWLYTGDLAFKDSDGDLFITGRKKNFIKIGANRVNPVEIEQFIEEDPRVAEAAAVGIDDKILGKKIRLFVSFVPSCEIKAEEIIKRCKENLPSYKVPSDIVILKSLPKNSYGKIDKYGLERLK